LQWHDVNFADGMIHVRRTWTCGQVGLPKSKASKGPVPLHPLLAEFMLLWKQKTTCSHADDWVFPSTRLDGKQPRVANMLVEDHLRPASVKAGTLSSHPDNHGRLIDDDPRRFGFHNLRHCDATLYGLVTKGRKEVDDEGCVRVDGVWGSPSCAGNDFEDLMAGKMKLGKSRYDVVFGANSVEQAFRATVHTSEMGQLQKINVHSGFGIE